MPGRSHGDPLSPDLLHRSQRRFFQYRHVQVTQLEAGDEGSKIVKRLTIGGRPQVSIEGGSGNAKTDVGLIRTQQPDVFHPAFGRFNIHPDTGDMTVDQVPYDPPMGCQVPELVPAAMLSSVSWCPQAPRSKTAMAATTTFATSFLMIFSRPNSSCHIVR